MGYNTNVYSIDIHTNTLTAINGKAKMNINIYHKRKDNLTYIIFQVLGKKEIIRFKLNFNGFKRFLRKNGIIAERAEELKKEEEKLSLRDLFTSIAENFHEAEEVSLLE